RSGLLGEIGTTYPWTENERKVLRASVSAQRETGAPLMIHPGRHPDMPMQLAEFVRKEGGDLRRTIMCHICRTIADMRAVIDLAQTGLWLEYDLFGLENSYYPYNPSFDMPNDGGRMAHVLALIAAGHQDQILMSHDIAYKTSLVKYGGEAYTHLLAHLVPRTPPHAGARALTVPGWRRPALASPGIVRVGPTAEVGARGGTTAVGLDWFLLNLFILALVFVPLERVIPRLPQQAIFRQGWTTDLMHFAMSHLLVQVTVVLTMLPAAFFFRWATRPWLQDAVASQPLPLQ